MELKLFSITSYLVDYVLLIVPYGIETTFSAFYWNVISLLIVPYGIETIKEKWQYGNVFIF